MLASLGHCKGTCKAVGLYSKGYGTPLKSLTLDRIP